MKKIILFLLSALLVVSLSSVFVSAVREEEGSAATAKNVAFSIGAYETKPTIDGVISEGEYTKVDLQSEWMVYVINDEDACIPGTTGADFKLCKSTVIDFYGSFDSENLYLAWGVHISAENYVQNWTNSPTNMHAQTALQVKIGDSYITSAWDGYDEFIKFQVARDKESGTHAGVLLHKASSVPGATIDDITYHITWSEKDELLVYEMQIPAKTWTFGNLEAGSSLGICWTVCVGGDPARSWNNYSQIMMAYGNTGSHGAACNGLALMTLGTASTPSDNGENSSSEDPGNIPVIKPEDTTDGGSNKPDDSPDPGVSAEQPTEESPIDSTATEAPGSEGTDDKGCSSSLALGGMAVLLVIGGAAIALKRKD